MTPNELLPEEHRGAYRSNEELERNILKSTQVVETRDCNRAENNHRFLCSSRIHNKIPPKESAVPIYIAISSAQCGPHFSVIREPVKLDITVHNSGIAKFAKRDDRKTKVHARINRRGPSYPEKSPEQLTNDGWQRI